MQSRNGKSIFSTLFGKSDKSQKTPTVEHKHIADVEALIEKRKKSKKSESHINDIGVLFEKNLQKVKNFLNDIDKADLREDLKDLMKKIEEEFSASYDSDNKQSGLYTAYNSHNPYNSHEKLELAFDKYISIIHPEISYGVLARKLKFLNTSIIFSMPKDVSTAIFEIEYPLTEEYVQYEDNMFKQKCQNDSCYPKCGHTTLKVLQKCTLNMMPNTKKSFKKKKDKNLKTITHSEVQTNYALETIDHSQNSKLKTGQSLCDNVKYKHYTYYTFVTVNHFRHEDTLDLFKDYIDFFDINASAVNIVSVLIYKKDDLCLSNHFLLIKEVLVASALISKFKENQQCLPSDETSIMELRKNVVARCDFFLNCLSNEKNTEFYVYYAAFLMTCEQEAYKFSKFDEIIQYFPYDFYGGFIDLYEKYSSNHDVHDSSDNGFQGHLYDKEIDDLITYFKSMIETQREEHMQTKFFEDYRESLCKLLSIDYNEAASRFSIFCNQNKELANQAISSQLIKDNYSNVDKLKDIFFSDGYDCKNDVSYLMSDDPKIRYLHDDCLNEINKSPNTGCELNCGIVGECCSSKNPALMAILAINITLNKYGISYSNLSYEKYMCFELIKCLYELFGAHKDYIDSLINGNFDFNQIAIIDYIQGLYEAHSREEKFSSSKNDIERTSSASNKSDIDGTSFASSKSDIKRFSSASSKSDIDGTSSASSKSDIKRFSSASSKSDIDGTSSASSKSDIKRTSSASSKSDIKRTSSASSKSDIKRFSSASGKSDIKRFSSASGKSDIKRFSSASGKSDIKRFSFASSKSDIKRFSSASSSDVVICFGDVDNSTVLTIDLDDMCPESNTDSIGTALVDAKLTSHKSHKFCLMM